MNIQFLISLVLCCLGFVLIVVFGVCGLVGLGVVWVQFIVGMVFGKVFVGDIVFVVSIFIGVQCEVYVVFNGCYVFCVLLVGIYMIMLQENGKFVLQYWNVLVVVGCGIKVDFDGVVSKE